MKRLLQRIRSHNLKELLQEYAWLSVLKISHRVYRIYHDQIVPFQPEQT